MKKRILCLILLLALCVGAVSMFSACQKETRPDSLVIMTDVLDGLFNPFFSTSAADSTIVSMTQIGMLTSKVDAAGNVQVAFGDDEAVVTKDYMSERDEDADETTYTFVLKNGIKYSDGHPLTMEDVLFNLYVYLDPVYTGSATMYSTDIKGLQAYRTQTYSSQDNVDEQIAIQAQGRAEARIYELINLFTSKGWQPGGTYELSEADMRAAILGESPSDGYRDAVALPDDRANVSAADVLKDYEHALELFKEELESDYASAINSYTEAPYNQHDEFKDPVFCFMVTEGFVTIEYEEGEDGKIDRTKIKKLTKNYTASDKKSAIDYVYQTKVSTALHEILSVWATAQKLMSEYTAKATEIVIKEKITGDSLLVESIEGIVSLGHKEGTPDTIEVNGTTYKIAKEYNADGTPKNSDEYAVLQITIEGVDPKAHWNFAFSVAPQHYYGEGAKTEVDIANNKFGVDFAAYSDFMQGVVQKPRNVKLPVGAGAYKVTNRANSDTPSASEFYDDNVVYFKANNYFETVGSGLNNAKIEKVRYQVVNASDAIGVLKSGDVHYVTPQLTKTNFDLLEGLKDEGISTLQSKQLGYGYIGVNASKINDINLRKAILYSMNTALALDYYRTGSAEQIYWPMSTVSWAYPKDENGNPSKDNLKPYPQIGSFDKQIAIDAIKQCMADAGVEAGNSKLKLTFTIAGSNVQDHPTYKVFRDAANLLNDLGWDITVEADINALSKLTTGSLEVWAAAWGSTIDPDLYQVYHKNSTATSTKAWGYDYLKNGTQEEKDMLNELSDLIDAARETLDQNKRTEIYEEAMGIILDLAIELPVYQRTELYAYNSKVIDSSTLPSEINPYSSPLDKLWTIDFVK